MFVIDSTYVLDIYKKRRCLLKQVVISKDTFTCSNVGSNTVTMTVTDVNGNVSSCSATVTVKDNLKPIVNCKNVTVFLDNTGNFSIDSSYINKGSTDNCGISTIKLSKEKFDCSNVGSNTVTMTVTDVNGNISSCSATVTVKDRVKPITNCKSVTVYLDANGKFIIDSSYINNGSTDNCGISTIKLSKEKFDCSNVGSNTVTMTVTDVNGNVSSCSATVTVKDNLKPIANCKNVTVYLDANGKFTIDSSYINKGSTDNCGISTIKLSKEKFDCSNVGSNAVTMTVTDVNGNISSCSATVTVKDNLKPIVNCKNVTVFLDTTGNFSIDSSYINKGSMDNCGISTIKLSKEKFDCSNVGSNTVTMTVTDVNGNISSCSATVTVKDRVKPISNCKNVTVYLDANGKFIIDSSYINNGSMDNFGISTIKLSKEKFDCSNVGSNTVTMTVTDVNGNVSSCSATLTVKDNLKPIANCKNVTVYLDANGKFTIDSSYINNGSTDNCGISTIKLSKEKFDCSNVGSNTITMTVTDVNENISSCSATVTVKNTIVPYANAGGDSILCELYSMKMRSNLPLSHQISAWTSFTTLTTIVFSDTNDNKSNVTGLIVGTNKLIWSISNGFGCIVNCDTIDIVVKEKPVVDAGKDSSYCTL